MNALKYARHNPIFIFVVCLIYITGCSEEASESGSKPEDTAPVENIPSSGVYFEVYGSTTVTNNISYSVTDKSFIGTSNTGRTFNLSGYKTFIIYVPSEQITTHLDAIRLNNIIDPAITVMAGINIGGSVWINSGYGNTDTHVTSNFPPFHSSDPSCIEFSSTCTITSGSGTIALQGHQFIEGINDGLYIKNTENEPAYYISNTLGASTIDIFLAN